MKCFLLLFFHTSRRPTHCQLIGGWNHDSMSKYGRHVTHGTAHPNEMLMKEKSSSNEWHNLMLERSGAIDDLRRSELLAYSLSTAFRTGETTSGCSSREDQTTIWDEPACPLFIVAGGLQVCGDLKVAGALIILPSMKLTEALENRSPHLKMRCTRGAPLMGENKQPPSSFGNQYDPLKWNVWPKDSFSGSAIAGTLVIPRADLYIIGDVEVGSSTFVDEIVVEAGGSFLGGVFPIGEAIFKTVLQQNLGVRVQEDEAVSPLISDSELRAIIFDSNHGGIRKALLVDDFRCPVIGPWGQIMAPHGRSSEYVGVSLSESIRLSEPPVTTNESNVGPLELPIGDLAAVNGTINVVNGGRAVTFGNSHGEAIIIGSASTLVSLCGHTFTNATSGQGVVVLDGSHLVAGGFLESQTVSLLVQNAGSVTFRGSAVASTHFQVDDSSSAHIGNDLLTAVLAVDDKAIAMIRGNLDVVAFFEVIDGGSVITYGNMTTSMFQCFDGGKVVVGDRTAIPGLSTQDTDLETDSRSGLIAKDFGIIGGYGSVEVHGDAFFNNSLHVANSSYFGVFHGDVLVEGSVRIISNSEVTVDGGSLVSTDFTIVGEHSSLKVSKNLILSGRPLPANSTDTGNVPSAKLQVPHRFLSTARERRPTKAETVRHLFQNNSTESIPQNSAKASDPDTDLGALPALYAEASEVIVGNVMHALVAWLEFAKASTVTVYGSSLRTHESNSDRLPADIKRLWVVLVEDGIIALQGGSTLNVTQGSVHSSKSISAEVASSILVNQGDLEAELFMLTDHSRCIVDGLVIHAAAYLTTRSWLSVNGPNPALFNGEFLAVYSGSQVHAPGLVVSKGYVHVESSSYVGLQGSIPLDGRGALSLVAKGDIVAQNRGSIKANHTIWSTHGGVIAENHSSIVVIDGTVDAMSIRRTPDSTLSTSDTKPHHVYLYRPTDKVLAELNAAFDKVQDSYIAPVVTDEKVWEEIAYGNTWDRWTSLANASEAVDSVWPSVDVTEMVHPSSVSNPSETMPKPEQSAKSTTSTQPPIRPRWPAEPVTMLDTVQGGPSPFPALNGGNPILSQFGRRRGRAVSI